MIHSLHIDRSRASTYLYQQLYQQLKQSILQRDYQAHDQLPSKRDLAQSLQVSLNSVNAAYQQLVAEGYVYTIERRGYFVEEMASFQVEPAEKLPPLPAHLQEYEEDATNTVGSFSHMSADLSAFPLEEWLRCEQRALKKQRSQLEQYVHPQGIFTVRKTLARLLSLSRGVKCRPEQIVLGAGTQLLMRQLTKILDTTIVYGMEEPGYQRIHQLLQSEGKQIRPICLDEKGIRVDILQKLKVSAVITTPSHQFPTGVIMPISRRIELLNWAASGEGRYIVEDDYDSEFKYDADSIPSLQSLDGAERVIYMGTFSKSLLPGLRISYMVLPLPLLALYKRKLPFLLSSCNTLSQLALQQFIESGEYQKHIKKMTNIYRTRRTVLIEELEKRFGENIRISGANSGLHFVAEFYVDKTEEEIQTRAKELGIEVYSMGRFRQELPKLGPSLVIGFAQLNHSVIKAAVNKLYSAVMGE